jgi:hypothetical protein
MMLAVEEGDSPDEVEPPIISLAQFANQEEVDLPRPSCIFTKFIAPI